MGPPQFLEAIEATGFSTWLRESESPFAFYFILLFHTFGLALLVGLGVSVGQMRQARQERDAKALALAAEQRAREDETKAGLA